MRQVTTVNPPLRWMETMGRGSKVLVIDTGFDPATPWVFPEQVRSFVGTPAVASHDGHGEAVCQIIASQNPVQMGVAPACRLFVARAIGPRECWTPIIQALDWAKEIGADVVNMSFAYNETNTEISHRLEELDRAGMILVSSYSQGLRFPHSLPCVLAVGGIGTPVGVDMMTGSDTYLGVTQRGHRFWGTSVAAAVVSGVVACGRAADAGLVREDIPHKVSHVV